MHIPFEKLPTELQEKVMGYLQVDNFLAAKSARDHYEERLKQAYERKLADDLNPKLGSRASHRKNLSSAT